MNKNVRALLIVLVILGGLAWFGIQQFQANEAMTASTKGEVVKSVFNRDIDSSSLDETRIDYLYAVNGQSHRGQDSITGDKLAEYPAGKQIGVCFNPEEPSSSRIDRGGTC